MSAPMPKGERIVRLYGSSCGGAEGQGHLCSLPVLGLLTPAKLPILCVRLNTLSATLVYILLELFKYFALDFIVLITDFVHLKYQLKQIIPFEESDFYCLNL